MLILRWSLLYEEMCNWKKNENNAEKKWLQNTFAFIKMLNCFIVSKDEGLKIEINSHIIFIQFLLFISQRNISSNEQKYKKEIYNNIIHFPRNNSYRDETWTQLRIETHQQILRMRSEICFLHTKPPTASECNVS